MDAAGFAPARELQDAPVRSGWKALRHFFRQERGSIEGATTLHPGSGYLPGLDGLRALSVIAVLIFHARPDWLPGGFIGVEVFFVISGFIITRALLAEWQQNGRIAVRAFWLRRARRLLPAVGLLLAGVLAYVAAFEPDEAARLRGDLLAALAYITNWHLIVGGQSYFDSFQQPSYLRHLWSLAVEEQFYIVWPFVVAVGLPLLRRWGLFALVLAGIAASTAAMFLLYEPAGDNSRAYYGTDTRAAGLLTGAALAFLLVRGESEPSRAWSIGLAGVGVLALSGLAGLSYWLTDSRAFLYQGGFLSVSVLSVLAILATTRHNAFSRLLAVHPLRWIGVRSYGIYLWHWPIFMLTWPRNSTTVELILQVAAVLVISTASYALVEAPIRAGALGRIRRSLRAWPRQSWRFRSAAAFTATTSSVALAGLVAVAVLAQAPEKPSYFQTGSIQIRSAVLQDVGSVVRTPTLMGRVQTTLSAMSTNPRTCPSDNLSPGGQRLGVASTPFGSTCPQPVVLFQEPIAVATVTSPDALGSDDGSAFVSTDEQQWTPLQVQVPNAGEDTEGVTEEAEPAVEATGEPAPTLEPAATAPSVPPPPVIPADLPRVSAVGDSVMLGAAYTLAATIPGIDLDAAVGRQASAAIGLLQQKSSAGLLGDVVVVHIGNNGTLTADQFDQMMAIIGSDRRVIVLSLHVPRTWEDSNNAVILGGVARYANVVLVDWSTAVRTYEGMLYSDGIHLTPAGASYYTQLVVGAIGQ